jgi:hypothetical protein
MATPSDLERLVIEIRFILAIDDEVQQDLALTSFARRLARRIAPDETNAVIQAACAGA